MDEDGARMPAAANRSAAPLTGQLRATHAVKPRLAASMILLDMSGAEPKVLLGRRNKALAFLPNKYAFPGGSLETADRLMLGHSSLTNVCRKKLALRRRRGFPGPEAFALAAIREIFEETGLLLGTRAPASSIPVSTEWQAFTDLGFAPNLAALRFIARAVTPPAFPRRFDTSFFVADLSAVTHRVEGCVSENTELVELVWLPIEDALKLDTPRITAMILLELKTKIPAGFAAHLPVPYFYERNHRWIREDL
jgi:8-oxo-dGTP pyrophosphatase MutT (NUDIX family)